MTEATRTDPATSDAWPLACPICEDGLAVRSRSLVCPNGHTFDIAREGYVHLLPPQHRRRGIEGDSPEMVHARRRFLEAGHYAPLRDRVVEVVAAALDSLGGGDEDRAAPTATTFETGGVPPDSRDRACVLEAGCGEGYYIGEVAERVDGPVFVGTDLSKAAVRLAARRYHGVRFVVADTHRRLYLLDASVSVLLNIFAPRNASEFARIVRPGGTLLVVVPATEHLASLRAELGLLDVQEAKEARVREQMEPTFVLESRDELRYPLELPPDTVADLVAMGPSAWHREAGANLPADSRTTEAAFVLMRFRRANR